MKLTISMINVQRLILSIFLLLLSVTATAKDEITTDIIELSVGLGYYNFDSTRNFNDEPMGAAGLGLFFSRRWAAILNYSTLNTKRNFNDGTSEKVDMRKYHVDVYRFFNVKRRWRPYGVIGFGGMDLFSESKKKNKEDQWNAGLGLYYRIVPKWSLR
ncbi:outer membrane beta-barrel protein, partial [Kaarinaea lacus]